MSDHDQDENPLTPSDLNATVSGADAVGSYDDIGGTNEQVSERSTGYCSPPISGQFRKGDGRKRPGRPKGQKNIATGLHDILTAPVPVTARGKKRNAAAYLASAQQSLALAFKGDRHSMKRIDQFAASINLLGDRNSGEALAPLSPEQEEVLHGFMRRAGIKFDAGARCGVSSIEDTDEGGEP